MGRSTPQTHAKRQREYAKQEKRRRKIERRAERKAIKDSGNAPLDPQPDGSEDASDQSITDRAPDPVND